MKTQNTAMCVILPEHGTITSHKITGSCLDSSISPVLIRDGDQVRLKHEEFTLENVINHMNEIIAIKQQGVDILHIKHLVGIDKKNEALIIRMYNPMKEFIVQSSTIEAFFSLVSITPASREIKICRKNPYLSAVEKIWREFLMEEHKGHLCAEFRLQKGISMAKDFYSNERIALNV